MDLDIADGAVGQHRIMLERARRALDHTERDLGRIDERDLDQIGIEIGSGRDVPGEPNAIGRDDLGLEAEGLLDLGDLIRAGQSRPRAGRRHQGRQTVRLGLGGCRYRRDRHGSRRRQFEPEGFAMRRIAESGVGAPLRADPQRQTIAGVRFTHDG